MNRLGHQGVRASECLREDLLEGNISVSKECFPKSRRSRKMITCEREFLKASRKLEQLVESVWRAGQEGRRIDEVERMLFAELLAIGRRLLTAYVASAGDGNAGQTIEVPIVAESAAGGPV